MNIKVLILSGIFLLTASYGYSQAYYKYVDKRTGKVWVTNQKPDKSHKDIEEIGEKKESNDEEGASYVPKFSQGNDDSGPKTLKRKSSGFDSTYQKKGS